jgi:serine/threonine protein kinase
LADRFLTKRPYFKGATMLTEEKTVAKDSIAEKSDILRLLPPEPGELVDGRFLILELLNEGGTSRVYKATDVENGDLVALKVPKEHFAQDAEFLERFRREEEIGLRARHPYLISMRRVPEKSPPYVVAEYVRGETLARRLASGPRPSSSEAARLAVMILGALEELHRQGVVHRDVTPQNVMLCEDGTVRLMDYGIAGREREGGAEEWTWGTPAYMAPEQVRNEPGDLRTDLYSLGVVLYEMLTGSVPFVGDDPIEVMNARLKEPPVTPRTLAPDLDPGLEEIVLRALAKEPKDRYPQARLMREALEPYAWGETTEPVPASRRWDWKAWFRENWAEFALAVLMSGLLTRIILGFRILSS